MRVTVAADEQIEDAALRFHLGERSISQGFAFLEEAVVNQGTVIGGREVWAVIKASAERRLGKPLLKAYMFLALFGIVVVAVCIVVMHL